MKLRLSPASPEDVLSISCGEVKYDELLNFKSNLPVRDGLLCQRIFGPVRNYVCECGKYNGRKFIGKTCENCGVTVLSTSSRSERMGHIDLQIPILNPMVFQAVLLILDVSAYDLGLYLKGRTSLYFNETDTSPNLILKSGQLGRAQFVKHDSLTIGIPNSSYKSSSLALYDLMSQIDIEKTYDLTHLSTLKRYIDEKFDLKWLFLRYLPVTPVSYRPVIRMDGHINSHPQNDLYGRAIRRATRIKTLFEYGSTPEIVEKEANLLFKAVNDLFISGSKEGPATLPPILSLFMGKTGLLRNNLLGKRVDFSGRSVVMSAGSELEMDQIGLPVKMAYILFKPFILNYLLENYVDDYEDANRLYDHRSPTAIKALRMVVKSRRVMMNRAPTLHRYGIMGFRIKLHNGEAIKVHPLVCAPFNMDFDGDTASIYVPLSDKALGEVEDKLSPIHNLLASLDGNPIVMPSHEMIIGLDIMTRVIGDPNKFSIMKSMDELEYLHSLVDPITNHPTLEINQAIRYKRDGELITTCYGRLIICNLFKIKSLPKMIDKKIIKSLISNAYDTLGPKELASALHKMMEMSFHYATKSGFSVAKIDCVTPSTKKKKVAEAQKTEDEYNRQYNAGEITAEARYENNIRLWDKTFKELQEDWKKEVGVDNSIVMMWRTGARVSLSQVSQLNVGKGLVSDAMNRIIEKPLINSLSEGLTPWEYFKSCSGSRKSMADKKNLTPKSGYLTRRMIYAARDFYITEEDCGSTDGVVKTRSNAIGRFTCDGELITKGGDEEVLVRSPITCKAHKGICVKCYGVDPATRKVVTLGTNVGAIAAHSLTESTTQMTMRTFHTSGAAVVKDSPMVINSAIKGTVKIVNKHPNYSEIRVISDMNNMDKYYAYKVENNSKIARILVNDGELVEEGSPLAIYVYGDMSNEDISGSLPKIESIFEARTVLGTPTAILATVDGEVNLKTYNDMLEIYVNDKLQGCASGIPVFVASGQYVKAGDLLSYGSVNTIDFYNRTNDLKLTYKVFEDNAMHIYNSEGLKPKHVHLEMIFRAMTDVVMKEDGSYGLRSYNEEGKILLNGISQASIKNPSWLKSIGFGWLRKSLIDPVINLRTSYDMPTEKIMSGELITLEGDNGTK